MNICSASKTVLENTKKFLGFNYGYIEKSKNIYVWVVYKKEHIKHLFEHMYKNHGVCLERKKEKFKNLV